MTSDTRDHLHRPLRDLRVSVTDRCNFRCDYCMPASIFHDGYRYSPRDHLLSFEEIERLVRIAVTLGVTKVRLTGGEPLMRSQLPRLVERLSAIDGVQDLALTTNGYLLADHIHDLANAGLQRVTVSLDAIDPALFARCAGRDVELSKVLAGIHAVTAAGLPAAKINCVVQRGVNDDHIVALAQHFQGTGHVVRFIEYMDVGTLNHWDPTRVVSGAEVLARLSTLSPLLPVSEPHRHEVARRYRYVDGSGEVGFINSVSEPFCGDCQRARLSADGRLLTCLFSTDGISLRDHMRSGASNTTLSDLLRRVWQQRRDRYSELRNDADGSHQRRRLEMFQVGG